MGQAHHNSQVYRNGQANQTSRPLNAGAIAKASDTMAANEMAAIGEAPVSTTPVSAPPCATTPINKVPRSDTFFVDDLGCLDNSSNFLSNKFCGHTCATTLRLTKPFWKNGDILIGDSWFGSLKTCEELLDVGVYSVLNVK